MGDYPADWIRWGKKMTCKEIPWEKISCIEKKNSHDVQCLKTIQRFAKKNSSRFNQTTHIPVKGKWSTAKYTKEGSLKREQPYE